MLMTACFSKGAIPVEESQNGFQSLVLDVISREIVPDLSDHPALIAPLRKVLIELEGDISWRIAPTPKHCFCWGIIATFCSKIEISESDFDWLRDHYAVVIELTHFYSFYCRSLDLPHNDWLIDEQLPEEILANTSQDLQRCVSLF